MNQILLASRRTVWAGVVTVSLLAILVEACSDYSPIRPTRIGDAGAAVTNAAATGGLMPLSGQHSGSSALAATIQFGQPDVGSPFPPSAEHDESAHAKDNLVPRTVVINEGGTVTFDVPAGVHQIAIYAPGTKPEDINTAALIPLCPGPTPRLINDPTNRVALITHACGSAWQAQYTFNTSGRYLVICAFLPHFEVGMYGWVEVRDRDQ